MYVNEFTEQSVFSCPSYSKMSHIITVTTLYTLAGFEVNNFKRFSAFPFNRNA